MKQAIDCLNEAFRRDPSAIHSLIANIIPCNNALRDDPFVIVQESPVLPSGCNQVSALGLINGILSACGLPLVASKWSEPDESGRRKLLGFCEYIATE